MKLDAVRLFLRTFWAKTATRIVLSDWLLDKRMQARPSVNITFYVTWQLQICESTLKVQQMYINQGRWNRSSRPRNRWTNTLTEMASSTLCLQASTHIVCKDPCPHELHSPIERNRRTADAETCAQADFEHSGHRDILDQHAD